MNPGWSALLLGAALWVWPVPSMPRRRLTGLELRGRVRTGPDATTHASRVPRCSPVLAGGLVLSTGALLVGPALAVAITAGAAAVALPVRASARAARRARFRRDLALALAVLQGELDAGTGAPQAMAAARERAGSARDVLDADVRAGPEARVFAAGARVVAVTGAPWSEVVAGIARDVAARAERDREVEGALAGSRASMLVLAGLPVLGIGLAGAMGAHPTTFLLHAAAGRALLAVGALLQLAGVWATVALAGRAAR